MPKTVSVSFLLLSLFCSTRICASSFVENFSSNPLQNGWKVYGDGSLFAWDSTNQNLQVTWDSSRPNSYLYRPLGTVLARDSDFQVTFDFQLTDIGPGLATNKASSFPIAIGFLNLDTATKTNFVRGTGSDSPNLAEFSYFWDSGFGATTWPVLVDTNSTFNFNGASDYAIFSLAPGDWYHIVLSFTASNQTLVATVTNFSNTVGVRIIQPANSSFGDYRLGSFSISSYSDSGQDPQFAGSVLAHGTIDNLAVTVPSPPNTTSTGLVSNDILNLRLAGQTNWLYSLQKSSDFQHWTEVTSQVPGNGLELDLADTNAARSFGFYRVHATRP